MFTLFKKKTLRSEWEALQRKYDIKRSILLLETPSIENDKAEYTAIISGTEPYDEFKFSKLFSAALNMSKTLLNIIDCMNRHVVENIINASLEAHKKAIEAEKNEIIERKARKKWN